jgi:hypothetical protein
VSLRTAIGVVAKPLVFQRVHAGNTSANAGGLERDTFPTLDRFFSSPSSAPYTHIRERVYARHWMICSGSYLHQRQLGSALRCLARGVATHPASVGQPLAMPLRWLQRTIGRRKGPA